ncbi:MAG: hypothetical protein H0T76_27855 [Nannocystis sp.]|nr:hypothetical protein [Nannocystis sp.]MBA3550308.1 hypothetical protein [Nannocystis sp.]
MLIHRHRMARLIELSTLERSVRDIERTLREEDVALLIKAAYDDATEAARAEFMARVKPMPTSAWPWSAVQAVGSRMAAPAPVASIGSIGTVKPAPRPGPPISPALLVLLRGQADAVDADPGNRLPARESPEGASWEPLHRALDAWDTATITAWIGPMGWVTRAGATAGQVPAGTGVGTGTGIGTGTGSDAGAGTDIDTSPSTGASPEGGPCTPGPPTAFSWKHPAVLAAGASMASTLGVILFSRRSRAPVQEKR